MNNLIFIDEILKNGESLSDFIILYSFMYLTTLLTLLVLSASLNCPLSEKYRSTALSGSLSAEPDASVQFQDMKYTNNFETALAQVPQVCLGISAYEDQNIGFIKINIDTESITQESFVVHVSSPAISKWSKLEIHYLASTKSEIEIGLISTNQPTYDTNGYISLKYVPTLVLNKDIKIRQFIVGIDIQAYGNGALTINFEKIEIGVKSINFIFSSVSCNIYGLSVSVVIFDPNTPGILFVDGSIEQNSLSTSTEVKVQRTSIQELRIYFVGFNSLNAKDTDGIKLSVSFSGTFSLLIDSTRMKSIKVNYLVISFVDCGSCSGYPFYFGDTCYQSCPRNTVFKSGRCVPVDCKNGFQLNNNRQCVPICGPNKYFSGKSCTCIDGYNMIQGQCSQCPVGTAYNYMTSSCDPLCGQNSQYNPSDRRCYCYNGYVVVNGQCTTCPAGTQYDPVSEICLNKPITCGINEVIAYGKCMCASNFYRINGVCQQCPKFSTYSLGSCQCDSGYTMNRDICVPNCRDTETLVNWQCQCKYGLIRNSYGICVPITCGEGEYLSNGQCICINGYTRNSYNVCVINCPQYEVLVNKYCACIPGYTRSNDGRCYPIQCQPGFYFDQNSGSCVPRCAAGTTWDQSSGRCIPQCSSGYIFDATYSSCIPVCPPNQRWNGRECICASNCGENCRPNEIWNGRECVCATSNCQFVCPPGTYYDVPTRRCASITCPNNQVWINGGCGCQGNYIIVNGICVPPCQQNAEYLNGRCECRRGFYSINGVCSQCPQNQIWDDRLRRCVGNCPGDRTWSEGRCVCSLGSWEVNGNCISCKVNQVFNLGRCQCIQGLYRINGVCSTCPPNYQWNPILNNCLPIIPTCQNGKVWDGNRCSCPSGTFEAQNGVCSKPCSKDRVTLPNGECGCREGQTLNQYGACISVCGDNSVYINGRCQVSCGNGEEWSGYNCVCKPNYERVAPNFCAPMCGRNQLRQKHDCRCIDGYQKNNQDLCVPIPNTCPPPHRLINGICTCANGYERNQQGFCIQVCQPGYTRNNLGYCVVSCGDDKILIDGKCACRVGLYNVNGLCQRCPEFSNQINGRCICVMNNYPVAGGASCPVPSCTGSYSYWDANSQSCQCRKPAIKVFGQCQVPLNCKRNEVWNGVDCICEYGYRRINGICQQVNQVYYCPDNSIFNGVNCQCRDGFYPLNGQACQRCPTSQYWNGQQCIPTSGSCLNGFQWDRSRYSCIYNKRCNVNEYWDGANCVCNQGFFWIDGTCQQCPAGTVFDGKRCNSGQPDMRCRGPYSYFNGYSCVCIPGYWPLADGCVTCPSTHEWSGICCQQKLGLTRSVTDSYTSVPVILRPKN